MLPVTCRRGGSSDCRPRRSGSTPAGPGARRPRRSATASAVSRRTSRASRTTGPNRGRRSAGPPRSAAIRRTPGGCTTCTATPSSGAGTGITRNSRAASIRTCTRPRPRRACAGEGPGRTMAGPAGRRCGCGLNRSGVTTTSAFASRLSGRNRPDDGGPIAPNQALHLTGGRRKAFRRSWLPAAAPAGELGRSGGSRRSDRPKRRMPASGHHAATRDFAPSQKPLRRRSSSFIPAPLE